MNIGIGIAIVCIVLAGLCSLAREWLTRDCDKYIPCDCGKDIECCECDKLLCKPDASSTEEV